jgi:outer membrane protein, heavy metal efflux system
MARLTSAVLMLAAVPALLWTQNSLPEIRDSLVVEALRNNPAIAAEARRVVASMERVDQAGTLDPPLFVYRLMEFPGTDFGQANTENFGLMQDIRFPTKLALESDIASDESIRARLEEKTAILELIAEVKSSAAMLWRTRAMLEISRENQRLLRQILAAAQTRYSVGKTSQQDVLKADIELTRLESQEIDYEQQAAADEAMLRSLLNRPSSRPVGPIENLPDEELELSLEQMLALARQYSPVLASDSVRINQADHKLSLRNNEYFPDLSVEVERVVYPVGGPSTWTVMATVSIPFAPWTLGRMSSGVQEAKAEKAESQSRFISSWTSLEARVRKVHARAKALSFQLAAYRDRIVPATEQSVESLLAAYQTGMTDFLMLLDGYRTYHEARMELTQITADYHQTLAELERELGVSRLASPTKEQQP